MKKSREKKSIAGALVPLAGLRLDKPIPAGWVLANF